MTHKGHCCKNHEKEGRIGLGCSSSCKCFQIKITDKETPQEIFNRMACGTPNSLGVKMTYTDEVKELKEKIGDLWEACNKRAVYVYRNDYEAHERDRKITRIAVREFEQEAKALKARIKAEGCGKKIDKQSFCNGWLAKCPACQAAIKELEEMLK
jgi:hypothetical protein